MISNAFSKPTIEDVQEYKHWNCERLVQHVGENIFKDIYGLNNVKTALALQLVNERRVTNTYNDHGLNILLVGDVGTGKTTLGKTMADASSHGYEIDATRNDDDGLLRFVRDNHPNLLCIDHLDYNTDLSSALNYIMDNDKVQVLGLANPIDYNFNKIRDIYSQTRVIDDNTYSKFSLVYAIKDKTNTSEEYLNGFMDKVLGLEKDSSEIRDRMKICMLLTVLRDEFNPSLSIQAKHYLKQKYSDLKQIMVLSESKRITTNDFYTLIQLTLAYARYDFSNEATIEHARLGFNVFIDALKSLDISDIEEVL